VSHATVGGTPVGDGFARCRDLCVTTQNTHKGQTSMPLARFEPGILASDGPQTVVVDPSATGIIS
jgi:hypothetical protein